MSSIYGNEANKMLTFTTRRVPLLSTARKYLESLARRMVNGSVTLLFSCLKMKAVHESNP